MEPTDSKPEIAQGEAATALGMSAPTGPDGWIGRVLDDRYRISERLGEGGMGAVFVAEHLKLHKSVALKVIRAELAGNGEVAARFAREAMASAQFEHPHVASAIDYGTLPEGGAYLVMQLVRGRALRDLLEASGRLPWRKACELLAQVADALSAARGTGIVHRDLKPENILVETREDGSELVKILDFGIAHVSPHNANTPDGIKPTRELTRVGTVMGTPGYMSPEQAVGDKIDHRTDLYALGCVLWECIAGECLWDGPDVTSIITRQMQGTVPRLREKLADPSIPRELDDLIQSLCARAVDGRPEHAGQVRDELRTLIQRNSQSGTGLVQNARLSLEHGALRLRALPGATRALLAVGALALVLGVAAWMKTSSHSPVGGTAAQAEAEEKAEELPAEVAADAKAVIEASRAADRRKAAQNLLAYKEPQRIERYLIAVAHLESARGCKDRKEAIKEISDLGDTRTLTSLLRLSAASKSGCGFLDLEDCYACIRADLRRAIDALDTKGPAAPTP